jgi:hypothetical protein
MTFRELLNLGIIVDSITVFENGCIRNNDIVDIEDCNWRKHTVGKVLRTYNGKVVTQWQVEEKLGSKILDKKVLGCFGLGTGMMGIVLED